MSGASWAAGGVLPLAAVRRGLDDAGPIHEASDVNPDGTPDVIITGEGAYGGARVLSGVDVMVITPGQVVQEDACSDRLNTGFYGLSSEALGVGDVHGDGFVDRAIGEVYRSCDSTWGLPIGPGSVWVGDGDPGSRPARTVMATSAPICSSPPKWSPTASG